MQLNSTAQGAAYRQSTTRYYPEIGICTHTHTHTHTRFIHGRPEGVQNVVNEATDIAYRE